MKALGIVVSDKKIFESCILKIYLLTPWSSYATNQNHLNNFCRGPPRDKKKIQINATQLLQFIYAQKIWYQETLPLKSNVII